jgi:hypothetical protein
MNLCDSIAEKLVADQALSPEQQLHLKECPDCQSIQATQGAVAQAAAAYRQFDQVGPAETAKVAALVNRPKQARHTFLRVAWASMALVVVVLVSMALLTDNSVSDGRDESGENLMALLDEVSEIANPSDTESAIDSDLPLFAMGLLEDDDNGSDIELTLPDSYQVLEEALDNSWL